MSELVAHPEAPPHGVTADDFRTALRAHLATQLSSIEPGELATAEALGLSEASVASLLKENRLFSIAVSGQLYYPAFFADPRYRRQDLERVSVALGELNGLMKFFFFRTPRHSLDGHTPLEILRSGSLDGLMRTVKAATALQAPLRTSISGRSTG